MEKENIIKDLYNIDVLIKRLNNLKERVFIDNFNNHIMEDFPTILTNLETFIEDEKIREICNLKQKKEILFKKLKELL